MWLVGRGVFIGSKDKSLRAMELPVHSDLQTVVIPSFQTVFQRFPNPCEVCSGEAGSFLNELGVFIRCPFEPRIKRQQNSSDLETGKHYTDPQAKQRH